MAAAESGLIRQMIEDEAYQAARRIDTGEAVVVGVNRFVREGDERDVTIWWWPVPENQSPHRRLRLFRAETHEPAKGLTGRNRPAG